MRAVTATTNANYKNCSSRTRQCIPGSGTGKEKVLCRNERLQAHRLRRVP